MLLAIDPGRDTGWSIWYQGALVSAGLGLAPRQLYDEVVIEVPEVYPGGPKVDPNDLITLAVLVGRYVERYNTVSYLVKPKRWKGQVPKEIHHRRLRAAIPGIDKHLVGIRETLKHNVLDAIGIGQWAETTCLTGAKLGYNRHKVLSDNCILQKMLGDK